MIAPKLAEGLAELWHGGAWVDALTDEVARDTSVFTRWANGYSLAPQVTIRAVRKRTSRVEWTRLAHYKDANGREWRQRSFWRRGIMQAMIVKVELQTDMAAQVAMISNKDGSLRMTVSPTAPLLARMGGQTKRFFDAEVLPSVVELGERKPDQDW